MQLNREMTENDFMSTCGEALAGHVSTEGERCLGGGWGDAPRRGTAPWRLPPGWRMPFPGYLSLSNYLKRLILFKAGCKENRIWPRCQQTFKIVVKNI